MPQEKNNKQQKSIIDIFVTIIDNYGDMGFACEFIHAINSEYWELYNCIVWTDNVPAMSEFVTKSGIGEILISDISDFWKTRKSIIGLLLLHASIPDMDLFAQQALILRIDYISLDPIWIWQNKMEHMISTWDRQIIELIPTPLEWWAGLIPPLFSPVPTFLHPALSESALLQKHITLFVYPPTLDHIDWDSFPSDMTIYVLLSQKEKARMSSPFFRERKNIIYIDFLPMNMFYSLLDTSEFAIIRWEVSWAHMIQGSIPFFWDMYRSIGGWPSEQSDQFLEFIWASREYRAIHQILGGQKEWKISYAKMLRAFSQVHFISHSTKSLIDTIKKHIDRFYNSI